MVRRNLTGLVDALVQNLKFETGKVCRDFLKEEKISF